MTCRLPLLTPTVALVGALALPACGTPQPTPPPVASPSPTVTSPASPPAPESLSAEAIALVAEARAKGLPQSRQATAAAITLLERAVRLDPLFARAHAELAVAYGTLDDAADPLVRRSRAEAAAGQAIMLNGGFAPALAALAFVRHRFDWRWTEADASFAKAVEVSPNDAFARHRYGVFLATIGRSDDALRELGRAAELDPASVAIRADMVAPLLRAGRVADARAAVNALAAAVTDGPLLHQLQSDVFAAEGRLDESAESLMKALAARGVSTSRVNQLRAAYKSGGVASMMAQRARQLAAELEDGPSPPKSHRLATDLALAHASMKHSDETLHWLAVAIDRHEDAPLYMPSSPALDFVRDEPRFKELLKRAKLDGK